MKNPFGNKKKPPISDQPVDGGRPPNDGQNMEIELARQGYHAMRQSPGLSGLSPKAQEKMVDRLYCTPREDMLGLSNIPGLQRLPLSMMSTIYNPRTLERLCKVHKRDNGHKETCLMVNELGQLMLDGDGNPVRVQVDGRSLKAVTKEESPTVLGHEWILDYALLGRSIDGLAFTMGVGVALEENRPQMSPGDRTMLGGPFG